MKQTLIALLSALFVAAACYSTGRLVSKGRSIAWPARIVLGMAVLSNVFFLLLVFRLGWPAVFLFTGGLCIAAFLAAHRPEFHKPRFDLPLLAEGTLGAFGLFYFAHALAPEIAYDGYGYHLALPAEWLRIGGFPARIGFYELLPQGMETMYAFALSAAPNSVAPKLVHFLCLVAIVFLLPALGRRMQLAPWAAPAAAVVFVACPVAGISAASAYSDVAFALSILAAFYLAVEAWKDASSHGWGLAGLAAGFCYAVKMPGLLVPAAICVLLLWSRKWKPAAAFAAGAAVTVLPWVARSWLLTGNPMAPMLNTLFPNDWFPPETDAEVRRVMQFLFVSGLHGFRIPLELALHGGQLGHMGPAVLAIPLGLLGLLRKHTRPIAAAGAILFIIYTQNLSARFLLPSFLFLVLALLALLPKRWALAFAAAAAFTCWPHIAALYADPGAGLVQWPYRAALGVESHSDYLHRRLPIYPFAAHARRLVPPGAKVFDCAGLPGFYSRLVTVQFWQTTELWRLYRVLLDGVGNGMRREAGRQFAARDIHYISMETGPAAEIPWAADFMSEPEQWGFRLAAAVGDYRLYEVSQAKSPACGRAFCH